MDLGALLMDYCFSSVERTNPRLMEDIPTRTNANHNPRDLSTRG